MSGKPEQRCTRRACQSGDLTPCGCADYPIEDASWSCLTRRRLAMGGRVRSTAGVPGVRSYGESHLALRLTSANEQPRLKAPARTPFGRERSACTAARRNRSAISSGLTFRPTSDQNCRRSVQLHDRTPLSRWAFNLGICRQHVWSTCRDQRFPRATARSEQIDMIESVIRFAVSQLRTCCTMGSRPTQGRISAVHPRRPSGSTAASSWAGSTAP